MADGASNQPDQSKNPPGVGMGQGRPFAPRRMWPEVVGLTTEEAQKKIKEDMPMAYVQVVQPNCFVTMDYNTRRVRLYVDAEGKVTRAPTIG